MTDASENQPVPPSEVEEEENDIESSRSSLIRRGIAIGILLVALVGAWIYWSRMDHAPRIETAGAHAPPPEVGVVDVAYRNVELRPRNLGQTVASQEVMIRARVRGFLLERGFEEGQRVEKGQLLYRIDPRTFAAELAQAQAGLTSAQAQHDRARRQVKRFQDLFSEGTATTNELEEWQENERIAAAEVDLRRAQVATAELDVGYTTIEAPFAGVIGRSLKDVGAFVDEGANSELATLRQIDPIYVRWSISEQDLLRWQRMIEAGQIIAPPMDQLELQVELSDGRVYPLRGRLNFLDVQVDPSTGTAVVRGSVPNPEGNLLPGQFVHVTVLGLQRHNVIIVPQQAVIQSPNGSSVFVITGDNTVDQRPVALGDWYGDGWIIEQGLEPGDRVAIDRLMQLRPDMQVAPVTMETPQPAPSPTTTSRPVNPTTATTH